MTILGIVITVVSLLVLIFTAAKVNSILTQHLMQNRKLSDREWGKLLREIQERKHRKSYER